ncbi:uncharacterized protein LOC108031191 [Drosophila biarmipes]|uniref:uncharacterized protein LOC108031191 n=1 Tax=Drosophila biarmipes TaxID=125945 RepID=UPI001CDA5CCE|nr:uncharacterized protein LOC108031191 [Drosophila biarmipes]XP_043951451.1 uncharacterized protein LOC108031191 [Drosophila biarmipes]
MRRSKAPSMRRAAKRETEDPASLVEPQSSCPWPSTSLPSEWGSSKGPENLGPRELKAGENPLRESRIFHVLWRNQTTKKHKTWTGNGTLVVTGSIVTLKDDTGKVVDTMTCFKQRDFKENDQLQVGTRDVEVQEEIKTLEECVSQRKLEIATWCQKIDALNGHSDTSPPSVANAPFRSHVLKKIKREENFMEVEKPSTWGSSESSKQQETLPHVNTAPCISNELERAINKVRPTEVQDPSTSRFTSVEYLCFLTPAALQESIFVFLAECIKKCKVDPFLIKEMVQVVCDHPVLLKTLFKNTDFTELMQVLEPKLPPWTEMGLYDSAKFEFVHVMLDHLVLERKEKCCILANTQDCLRLVVGYCQSYDIDHAQLDSHQKVAVFNSNEKPMVGLVLSCNLPEVRSLHCKHLIIYNHDAREEASQLLACRETSTKVYTPITSGGGPEEMQFYRRLGRITDNNSLGDLQNYGSGQMPSTVYELDTWTKIEPPFSNNFFEESTISDSLESLLLVYSRKTVANLKK